MPRTWSGIAAVLACGVVLAGLAAYEVMAQDAPDAAPKSSAPSQEPPKAQPTRQGSARAPSRTPKANPNQAGIAPQPAAAVAPVAPQTGPAPQQGAAGPSGELEPVLHARSANISTCMDNIVGQASSVIDSAHTAISSWVSKSPNEHIFQSIIGLSYPNKIAPNGASVILAAPLSPTSCEGGSVQIYPTAQPCSVVQASLIKSGRTIATLQALPVVQTNDGARNVLMPTAGSGCVIVTVRPR